MTSEDGARLLVTDTQKHADGLFVHSVTVEAGQVKAGDALIMQADQTRRNGLASHHSATHFCTKLCVGSWVTTWLRRARWLQQTDYALIFPIRWR